jgi:sigma-B regulation protein RsbU (phosphoserine phosphatase)
MAGEMSDAWVQDGLRVRRSRLEDAIRSSPDDAQLTRLLGEVDTALERVGNGTYGLCEVCHQPIEAERLQADPLTSFCLDHLSHAQRQALEEDLALASQVQERLLPKQSLQASGWEAAYYYDPAGPVSGDYCDLLDVEGGLHFVVGDVSGKGVSAAMLMAHLHAMLRALVYQGLPLDQVMARASRMLCENTLPTQFATAVCGKASATGTVQLSNAGHDPVLFSRGSEIGRVGATGLPLGMFSDEEFTVSTMQFAPGDTLLLHTDGVTETLDASGREYGSDRLAEMLKRHRRAAPRDILSSCIADLRSFRSSTTMTDDVTILVLRRLEAGSP